MARDKYMSKIVQGAIYLMMHHYQTTRDIQDFQVLMNGFEVTINNIEDNALIRTWGDEEFIKEIGDKLRENDIDVYDWSFRIKHINNDSGKTTKIIRVEFHEVAA
jgi:hypothetical protein